MRIRRAEEATEATKGTKATEATKATARGFRRSRLGLLSLFGLLIPMGLFADIVHVYERSLAGGVASQMSDRTLDTGNTYSTQSAPAKSGYIFTHWSISVAQPIDNRDRLGRAKEVTSFTLYEETTLTANYLAEGEDSDNDGIADGWEIYWYGDLSKNASSDTDNDGFTFAEELAAGTDPLMPDESLPGGIVWQDGALVQYNPDNLQPYTIRSEPEGALFATVRDYLKPGQVIPIPYSGTQGTQGTGFAYWTIDGVRQADRHGRALDTLSVTMPNTAIEIVAVSESDEAKRNSLYWYGTASVAPDSDTDGDGFTFAEELAAGTDPLMPDESLPGGIVWQDGALVQYNPDNLYPYVVRSEPEGALFATISDYQKLGTAIPIPSVSGNFAYWTIDGVRQADRHGRALDTLSVTMPNTAIEIVAVSESDEAKRNSLYWYGTASVAQNSDTDNDGFTFAEELAAGTDPLMPDESLPGGIVWQDGALLEMNLQPYEQVLGAVVGGAYSQVFTSPVAGNAATSATFGNGGAVWPVVADVNGDGLWDLVVCWEGEGEETQGTAPLTQSLTIFINVGTKGNPEFEVDVSGALGERALPWLAMNSPEKLAGLSLDVPAPGDALSATTNGTALLVSDSEGRIWYYKGTQATEATEGTSPTSQSLESLESLSSLSFTLQHKVWGGSHAGFAQGLRLAAVDWDDDGDLDCLAGTADGKLMLLRDPKVGRPTNLKALAGVDNVLLTWDPNAQSRIRGYRVYRAEGEGTASVQQQGGESTSGTEGFTRIAQPQLPTYRDFPNGGHGVTALPEYAYKVSSVSRFCTAGNSTPTETESPATEAVTARLGSVRFFWNDAATKVGEQFEVMLSIENSMNYSVTGQTEVVAYDPEYLTPVKVVKTGLTEECVIEETHGTKETQGTGTEVTGEWRITVSGASGTASVQQQGGAVILPAGGGKFLSLVFEAKKEGVTTVGGRGATALPASDGAYATVSIAARSVIAPYQLGDVDGDGDVDEADLRLLAKLYSSQGGASIDDNQRKAGDFNGNGKLDNADYQALRALLKERGL